MEEGENRGEGGRGGATRVMEHQQERFKLVTLVPAIPVDLLW